MPNSNTAENKDLIKKLADFSLEIGHMLPISSDRKSIDAQVIGKFRQAVSSTLLWYTQWNKHRDYSSAINASMSLGKLSQAADMLQVTKGEGSNVTYDAIIHSAYQIGEECWNQIQAASGRIVPFES